jgi:cation diffusion facilitator CzcD-associated flavoprotein CzcO
MNQSAHRCQGKCSSGTIGHDMRDSPAAPAPPNRRSRLAKDHGLGKVHVNVVAGRPQAVGSEMNAVTEAVRQRTAESTTDFDAIVIGAGVSGLYQLYRLKELGMTARVFEAGSGVGGTWYWNRYPGARFDSESWTYGYSFSKELLEDWDWEEHFAGQPETERYLNHVADRFDLRRDIQFNTLVTAAHYQEDSRSWKVTLKDGSHHTARFLITAVGVLSAPTMPRIPGVESFKGQSCHTHNWPKEPVSFAGKRIAVIGTGATGIQTITEVAKTAGSLTVFQRTPRSRPRRCARSERTTTTFSRAARKPSAASSTPPTRARCSR